MVQQAPIYVMQRKIDQIIATQEAQGKMLDKILAFANKEGEKLSKTQEVRAFPSLLVVSN